MATLKNHGYIGTRRGFIVEDKEIYVWNISMGGSVPISKPGYKIKEVLIKYQFTNSSGSGRVDGAVGINETNTSGGKPYWLLCRTGDGYGYQGYGAHKYGAVWSSNDLVWCSLPSTGFTVYGGAGELLITKTGASVKVGPSAGNFTYQNTWTYQTEEENIINTIFESTAAQYILGNVSGVGNLYSNVIIEVTYEPRQNRTPTNNTIRYYPLKDSLTDVIGNYPWTSGAATYSNNMATITTELRRSGSWFQNNTGEFTISTRIEHNTSNPAGTEIRFKGDKYYNSSLMIFGNTDGVGAGYYNAGRKLVKTTGTNGQIYNVIATKIGTTMTVYVNGVSIGSNSSCGNYPGYNGYSGDTSAIAAGVKCAEAIVENRGRSAQEALDYFNQVKRMFGY